MKTRSHHPAAPGWVPHTRALTTILCGIGFGVGVISGAVALPKPIALIAFGVAYIAGGLISVRDFLRAARHLRLDINALTLLAAVGAATIGHWMEGAALLFLFSLSNTLENYAMGRTRRAVEALMKLSPAEARLVRNGEEVLVPVEQLTLGDVIRVRPGDLIPADGRVTAGQSAVNQAAITGESIPVEVAIGDGVFAGTLNQQGTLDLRVEKSAADSALAKVVRAVEEAQNQKAATQRTMESFGNLYAPLVLVLASAAVVVPTVIWHASFQDAFYRAMVLLVAASPCALIISIPAATLSAIANGAERGILFKSSNAVEDTSHLEVIALDKTGTLTMGQPQLTDVIATPNHAETDLLHLAASAEQRSEHPLAQAVVQAAKAKGVTLTEPTDFLAWPGEGLRANVAGLPVWVGNDKLLARAHVTLTPEQMAQREQLAAQGKTVVQVFGQEALIGFLALADQPRPEARAVVNQLRHLGVKTVMLTGDHETVARAIAAQVGIEDVYAGLSPQQKVEVVRRLAKNKTHVAMIGDGVNDAPALASATVGIAMGAAGSDVALETADIVLMGDDLTAIPYAVGLGRKTRRVVMQNVVFAIAIILILITVNYLGHLALPLGVVVHEGSTLLVVLNGLRLLRPLAPK